MLDHHIIVCASVGHCCPKWWRLDEGSSSTTISGYCLLDRRKMKDRGWWWLICRWRRCVQFILWTLLFLCYTSSSTLVSALSTLSPRVVHTKQSIFQGFLGPGNARIPKPYSSTYNIHGFGGRPLVEVSTNLFIFHAWRCLLTQCAQLIRWMLNWGYFIDIQRHSICKPSCGGSTLWQSSASAAIFI